jgi:hypothetical protein
MSFYQGLTLIKSASKIILYLFFKNSSDLHGHLNHIYSNIYVECIARNPLYRHKPDEQLKCALFISRLEEYLFSLMK